MEASGSGVPALPAVEGLEVGSQACLRPWLCHGLHFCISHLFHVPILYYFKLQTCAFLLWKKTQTI